MIEDQDITTIFIPVHTVSEANSHQHWRQRQKRAKTQRSIAHVCTRASSKPPLPVVVKLTRLAPRSLDTDNLQGALKHVRDGVADAYGVDDRGKQIVWEYDQRKAVGICGDGVLVEVRPR